MGIFRFRRPADHGWAMYAPLSDGWRPASLRSPAPKPGHAVLRQRNGELTRLQGREFAAPGDLFQQVDLRRRLMQMHPQWIPTVDGINVTITLALSVRTVDPVAYIGSAQGPDEEIYLAAQIALREYVSGLRMEELVGTRTEVSAVLAAAQEAGSAVGVEVSTVLLKDFSLPEEYRLALEESLVGRVRSETELERARAEVKATRARLASAKVLEQNPVLAKIRLLEALPPGTTLEVRPEP